MSRSCMHTVESVRPMCVNFWTVMVYWIPCSSSTLINIAKPTLCSDCHKDGKCAIAGDLVNKSVPLRQHHANNVHAHSDTNTNANTWHQPHTFSKLRHETCPFHQQKSVGFGWNFFISFPSISRLSWQTIWLERQSKNFNVVFFDVLFVERSLWTEMKSSSSSGTEKDFNSWNGERLHSRIWPLSHPALELYIKSISNISLALCFRHQTNCYIRTVWLAPIRTLPWLMVSALSVGA